jgi:hypothetical protein
MAEGQKPNELTPQQILQKLMAEGLANAHKQHANDATTYGNPQLPKGIERGIARLKDVRLGVYQEGDNKGKLFFMAQGIVKDPEEFEGKKIAGLLTKIGPEPLCDTPKSNGKRKTAAEHYAWVLNILRGLGVKTVGTEITQLPQLMEVLNKTRPHFYFRTWAADKETLEQRNGKFAVMRKGRVYREYATEDMARRNHPGLDKDPMVQHEWNGVTDWKPKQGDGVTTAMQDNTPSADETPEDQEQATPEVDTTADDTSSTDIYNSYDDRGDIYALQAMADEGDQHAQDTLQEYARNYGVSEDELGSAPDYAAIVALIVETEGWKANEMSGQENESPEVAPVQEPEEGQEGEGEETQPDEPPPTPVPAVKPNPKPTSVPAKDKPTPENTNPGKTPAKPATAKKAPVAPVVKSPEKGKVRKYQVAGANGSPAKEVEVEVIFVDEGKKVANVKALEDNRIYRSVPFDSLK